MIRDILKTLQVSLFFICKGNSSFFFEIQYWGEVSITSHTEMDILSLYSLIYVCTHTHTRAMYVYVDLKGPVSYLLKYKDHQL